MFRWLRNLIHVAPSLSLAAALVCCRESPPRDRTDQPSPTSFGLHDTRDASTTPDSDSLLGHDIPAGFWAKYSHRGGDPAQWEVAESASPHCRRQCIALTHDELVRLHRAFVRHAFTKMKTRSIEASPHRGGVCLSGGWEGEEHSLCDVTTTEIEPRFQKDFEELSHEVFEIFFGAQIRGRDGGDAAQ